MADGSRAQGFLQELWSFDEFGKSSILDETAGIPMVTNEFWTSKQRQAHRLHEISYRACFKPQLPRFFINRLTRPGDAVYDPFMGRGTTPLEAALSGRCALGNDTNPLSRALLAPRLATPEIGEVEETLQQLMALPTSEVEREDLLAFYHPSVLARLEAMRRHFIALDRQRALSRVDAWIRMVVMNRLTGHSSGFLSGYTLPPNQAVTVERQQRINAQRGITPPDRDVAAIILKKSRSLLSQGGLQTGGAALLAEPAENTPQLADGLVDLVVTSPPFLDIVNYEADNWLRCWFLGIDPKEVRLTQLRKIPDWVEFTRKVLTELARVVRPGGHVAYEVGEVRGATVRLEEQVIEAAAGLPLEPLAVMVNQQDFSKTSNVWGVGNNARGTNSNRIVVLRHL